MKSFFQFLSEATESQAAVQAKKLGLRGDGHGGWVDRAGKYIARTEKGKLKFIDGRQAAKQEPETEKHTDKAPHAGERASNNKYNMHAKTKNKRSIVEAKIHTTRQDSPSQKINIKQNNKAYTKREG